MKAILLMPRTYVSTLSHFEVQPDASQKTILVYIGQDCVCLRIACAFVKVDNDNVNTADKNHSDFCICNFVKIIGCDFPYLAPVVSHQLIKSNYTMYQKLSPTYIGMNLMLIRQLVKHQDMVQILREVQESRKKTLITIHHDIEEISSFAVRQDASHH